MNIKYLYFKYMGNVGVTYFKNRMTLKYSNGETFLKKIFFLQCLYQYASLEIGALLRIFLHFH